MTDSKPLQSNRTEVTRIFTDRNSVEIVATMIAAPRTQPPPRAADGFQQELDSNIAAPPPRPESRNDAREAAPTESNTPAQSPDSKAATSKNDPKSQPETTVDPTSPAVLANAAVVLQPPTVTPVVKSGTQGATDTEVLVRKPATAPPLDPKVINASQPQPINPEIEESQNTDKPIIKLPTDARAQVPQKGKQAEDKGQSEDTLFGLTKKQVEELGVKEVTVEGPAVKPGSPLAAKANSGSAEVASEKAVVVIAAGSKGSSDPDSGSQNKKDSQSNQDLVPVAPANPQSQAPTANVSTKAADTPAPLNDKQTMQVIRQVADRIELLAATRPRGGVTIHLNPPDLGSVTMVVKSAGSQVDARLTASNESVRNALEQSKHLLGQQLQKQGLQLASVSVSAESGNSTSNRSQNQNQQQFNQFAQANAQGQNNAGGQASSGREEADSTHLNRAKSIGFDLSI